MKCGIYLGSVLLTLISHSYQMSITSETSNVTTEMMEGDEYICNLPKVTGSCLGITKRFFFHPDSNECFQFKQGKCGGNENNFPTKELCESTCADKPDVEICKQPLDKGSCNFSSRKKMYYHEKGECKSDFFDECGGNRNKFVTEDECYMRCVMIPGDYCSLPFLFGTCALLEAAWTHRNGKCISVGYSGCGGNANTFTSEAECNMYCIDKEEDICMHPMLYGHCEIVVSSFRYDYDAGKCVEYRRTRCGGNKNDFPSMLFCQKQCPRYIPKETDTPIPMITSTKDKKKKSGKGKKKKGVTKNIKLGKKKTSKNKEADKAKLMCQKKVKKNDKKRDEKIKKCIAMKVKTSGKSKKKKKGQ